VDYQSIVFGVQIECAVLKAQTQTIIEFFNNTPEMVVQNSPHFGAHIMVYESKLAVQYANPLDHVVEDVHG
jgi:hypothetical protein